MKRIHLLLLALTPGMFLLSSCKKESIKGSGAIITETRDAKDFYKVSLWGSSQVYVVKGNAFKVEVKAYEILVPVLQTKVVNGTLQIRYDNDVNVNNDNAQIYITMPALVGLESYGSGKMHSTGDFLGMENFSAKISGSGEITIDDGSAKNFQAELSGSGNLNAYEFECQSVSVMINGSGNAKVHATENLQATISGSGNVYYDGDPIVQTKIEGSGQVVRK